MRLLLLLFALTTTSARALQLPKGLSKADREEVVETIGMGAATKMLTSPYPLGGYSGFEIGFSLEFIDVRDVNRLGCAVGSPGCANTSISDNDEFRFSRLSIGKGIYHDIDIFFQFAPPIGGTNISDYGAAVRWAFYQTEFLPITFSAVVHANMMNLQDDFINQNIGAELIAGITVDNFALYAGVGQIWSQGTFQVGNSGNGTVDPSDPDAIQSATGEVTEKTTETHTLVGISLTYENLFAAAEVNHYRDSVYGIKLGVRF
jgi:hypothetical protein